MAFSGGNAPVIGTIHHISLNRLKRLWHIKVVIVHNYEVGTMRVKGVLFDFSLFLSGDAFRDLQIQRLQFLFGLFGCFLLTGSEPDLDRDSSTI